MSASLAVPVIAPPADCSKNVALFNGTYRVKLLRFVDFEVGVSNGVINGPFVVEGGVVVNHSGHVKVTGVHKSPKRVSAHVSGRFEVLLTDGGTGPAAYQGLVTFRCDTKDARANGSWHATVKGRQLFGIWKATRISR